ncbi:alkaline phosphatase family protein [Paenibacillus crassostreae]|uniref:Phosphodiesterase n=1 Tax=Paenibacillus crassostreae TaxID=1763538 RepID=A0A167FBJ6_9BACL|nr:alkaline phosphatase family protein [Paenibacillus crassostreae]AOZ90852.1 phosphodiesterase [Paenibacillus crassostreae]OAB76382.1 phosphodiesterase [Paenibacillus crassostreae]
MRQKNSLFLMLICILLLTSGCLKQEPVHKEQDLVQVKSTNDKHVKKVILLLIDSLMAQAIDEGIAQKELPTLQFLIQHGQYYKELVSSFPTMSVTIDSSLLTGTYPDGHHVPGLTWYSTKEKKLINYGTGPMEIINHGVNPVLEDALINLNRSHLNQKIPTLYEDLAQRGLKSGSINGLIYRGPIGHVLTIPPWIQGPTSLPRTIPVKGPDYLSLGSLSDPLDGLKELPDGLSNRLGLNNRYSIETVKYLIHANKLPDFLYVYLPDLDHQIHKKGPSDLKGVKEMDKQLQSLLQSFGSPEEALKKATFIVVGDSGMTQILPAEENPLIELSSFFNDYKVLRDGESVTEETEIVLALNETMAYVYKLKADKLKDIAYLLKADPRIDIIAWKEKKWMYAIQGNTSKELKFKVNGKLIDPYQQKWTIKQDAEVLDLKINAQQQTVSYGKYPDVLQRLYGALHSHDGEFLIVTAKRGFELADRNSPTHKGGGGHGSIGKTESLVPLIISGTEQKPQYLRIIDLKSFLLKLLTK